MAKRPHRGVLTVCVLKVMPHPGKIYGNITVGTTRTVKKAGFRGNIRGEGHRGGVLAWDSFSIAVPALWQPLTYFLGVSHWNVRHKISPGDVGTWSLRVVRHVYGWTVLEAMAWARQFSAVCDGTGASTEKSLGAEQSLKGRGTAAFLVGMGGQHCWN